MKDTLKKHRVVLLFVLLGAGIMAVLLWNPLWDGLKSGYAFLTDRGKIETFITGFGAGAPLVFVALQILQVIFAPLPGEASGFLGGYLFGVWRGFFYSSVGLAAGSLINFGIGRFLGEHWVRRMVPAEKPPDTEIYQ